MAVVANRGVGDGLRRGGGDQGAGGGAEVEETIWWGGGNHVWRLGDQGWMETTACGEPVCVETGEKGVDQRWMKTSEGERDKYEVRSKSNCKK